MNSTDSLPALLSAWRKADQPVFTVFDPDFRQAGRLAELLHQQAPSPTARLRYLAVTESQQLVLPGLQQPVQLTPGLNYLGLLHGHIELHVWQGLLKQALQEFQGRFDAVLQAHPNQDCQRRLRTSSSRPPRPRRVAVLGAGIAGSSVALGLCMRGIEVHLYEAADQPAAGASGNWVGAFHPHITRGDSPLSRLSRLGFQHTLQALQALSARGLLVEGDDWATPGHLQTVPPEEADRTRETLSQLNFPTELVKWAEPGDHVASHLGGLFFPQGGWVKPGNWVRANLAACGNLLTQHYSHRLTGLDRLLSDHDAVVVCCAEQSIQLAPVEGAQVSAVKGQISKLRSLKTPGVVLSGESYAIGPPLENWMVVGATYERPATHLVPTAEADQENMDRFRKAFPGWPLGPLLDHRCGFRSVWHDRLPAIGPVPNQPNVYMSTGFASRGLLWAALGGWLVADQCQGVGMESKLLARIAPRSAKNRPVS